MDDLLPEVEVCVCPPYASCPVHSLDQRNDLELHTLRNQLRRVAEKFKKQDGRRARQVVTGTEAYLAEVQAEIVSRTGGG